MEFRKVLLQDYMQTERGLLLNDFFVNLSHKFEVRDNDIEFHQTVNSWLNGKQCSEASEVNQQEPCHRQYTPCRFAAALGLLIIPQPLPQDDEGEVSLRETAEF